METGNFDIRLRQWIRYELAARKIQRRYRQWRMYWMLYRRIKLNGMKRLNRSYDISDRTGRIHNPRIAVDNFQSILKQSANFNDKCSFWMKVIDLKRTFPDKSTDILLRSLIEANGDSNRAQILLGSSDFIFQNNQPLPSSVRSIFVPHVGPFEQQPSKYDLKFTKLLLISTNRLANVISPEYDEPRGSPEASMRYTRNMDLIRSLRGQHVQQRKQELMDTFMKIVDRGYFGQQKGKLPATATVRPKSTMGNRSSTRK
jgi:hypothetical protein